MKPVYKHVITALLFTTLCVNAGEMRSWKNKVGDQVEAEFVKEYAGTVYLRTPDGSELKIKRTDLCEEDQQLVAELSNPFPKKKSEEKKEAAPELINLFGKKILDHELDSVPVASLNDKIIGIYFSAHWCGPCRQFTPQLVEFHKKLQKAEKPFEIVFISSDHTEDAMKEYIEETGMPWLVMPFGDSKGSNLAKKYEIRGIPSLIIIDSKGRLITKNGRGDVSAKGIEAFDAWKKAAQ